MIELKWIKTCIQHSNYYFSSHGDRERQNDNLLISDIETILLNGKIIENYDDTGRGESCLVVGFTNNKKPVHAVCGRFGDTMVIITVYLPTKPKFINPFQRG